MNNNPIKFNDPSGHDVGNPGEDGFPCVPGYNCPIPTPTPTPPGSKSNTPTTSPIQTPKQTPTPPTRTPVPTKATEVTLSQNNPMPEFICQDDLIDTEPEFIVAFGDMSLDLLGLWEDSENFIKPAYKVRHLVPGGALWEGGSGFVFQALDDLDNELTFLQRLGRSSIAAVENIAIDAISTTAGGFGGAAGGVTFNGPGAVVGYGTWAMYTGELADRWFDSKNEELWPRYGLGCP